MEPDLSLLPGVAANLRGALSNLYFAASQLAPASQREADPALDAKAARLDQSYYQLLHMVNNLTALHYLESPLPLRDQDIVELVCGVFEQAASLAPFRGLKLRLVCPLEHHICAICGDAMEQLLCQLLSNAFKFTPSGGSITVELRLSGQRLLLSVEDSGPGIPPERQETLFESYRQSGSPLPPHHGMGLGLTLCSRIARGHGGILTAESHPGKGSRFTVSLPDRQMGSTISDLSFDYSGGFNRILLALADSMPPEAFRIRSL